jgi:hypothetical protein
MVILGAKPPDWQREDCSRRAEDVGDALRPTILRVPPVVFKSYVPAMGLLLPLDDDRAFLLRMLRCTYAPSPCPKKRQARRRKNRIRARIKRRGWN